MKDAIKEILLTIKDEQIKERILRLHADILHEMQTRPSSVRYHHKTEGGMYRHVHEVMVNALAIYNLTPELYSCTRDEVILATYVHDLDKLDRYIPNQDEWRKKKFDQDFDYNPDVIVVNQTAKVVQVCAEYGLLLNNLVLNGVTFHHGGFASDLASVYPAAQSHAMKPLSILLHCADLISSHIQGKGN